jgi:TolA-binding protein
MAACCAAGTLVAQDPIPGAGSGPQTGVRYATDAYPGFDNEKNIVAPERKAPRWFSFVFGPECADADNQLVRCTELIRSGDFAKARRQLDALVREWPTTPQAAKAQQALAELCLTRLGQTEDAFAEYRYLLDFYSSRINYDKIADKLYEVAKKMKAEGKEVCFVRFENVVDVRRAFEACVLHAPGAKWVAEAMLAIGELREKEGEYGKAVQVYENLRNLYPGTEEAKASFGAETRARLVLLEDHAYNDERMHDTQGFFKLALQSCRESDRDMIREALSRVEAQMADEAYRNAQFYDSKTRTKRSAINAYEKFLAQYPEGARADEARARLEELKGEDK